MCSPPLRSKGVFYTFNYLQFFYVGDLFFSAISIFSHLYQYGPMGNYFVLWFGIQCYSVHVIANYCSKFWLLSSFSLLLCPFDITLSVCVWSPRILLPNSLDWNSGIGHQEVGVLVPVGLLFFLGLSADKVRWCVYPDPGYIHGSLWNHLY